MRGPKRGSLASPALGAHTPACAATEGTLLSSRVPIPLPSDSARTSSDIPLSSSTVARAALAGATAADEPKAQHLYAEHTSGEPNLALSRGGHTGGAGPGGTSCSFGPPTGWAGSSREVSCLLRWKVAAAAAAAAAALLSSSWGFGGVLRLRAWRLLSSGLALREDRSQLGSPNAWTGPFTHYSPFWSPPGRCSLAAVSSRRL
ncbi:hypothetical protein LEMLEM_LOCUS25538 [Lemmus lemmus]